MSEQDEPIEEEAVESLETELRVEAERAAEAAAQSGPDGGQPVTPSFRDRVRPVALLVMSAACGVFAGLIALLTTRDWELSGVMLGVAFIVALVVLAMISIGGYEPQQPPSPRGFLVDNEKREDSKGH